ncbi:MAG: energy transducer TonB [Gammaproteobacteria bacterium]|nr:energy transducer TonB [Gammaproteobacteria bacterium]
MPVIRPVDRLGLTLCLAVITHAVIVLGVTFTPEDAIEPRYDTMEIVLVREQTPTAPEQATLLAQASLEGGGDAADQVIPATPLPPPFPDAQAAIVQSQPAPAPPPRPERKTESRDVLAAEAPGEPQDARKPDPVDAPQPQHAPAAPPRQALPSAAALLTNSFKIAALSAEIKEKLEAQAQRPKRKFVSASTREYKYAAYMEAWRAKVERVGNLNYPDEARKRQLSGSLILDVALNPDGSVNDIVIRRSSGQKILDDAAVGIVHLAAPFAPFPNDIRKETDILHITRTWQFLNNAGFR